VTSVDACRFSLETPDLLQAHAAAHHFDPHLHATFSLVIVTKGRAWLQAQNWRSTVAAGDAFLFSPFQVHAGGDLQGPVEYEVLYPSMRFVADSVELGEKPTELPCFRATVLRSSAATQTLLESLSSSATAAAKVESALQGVLRSCSLEPIGVPARAMTAVRTACQVIHDESMQPIDTQTLARHARLNKSHFIRVFHRVTGLAPQSYLRQVRVARARELICAGAGLAETAQATGFCDQPHLTREFKKIYGVTPGHLSRDVHSRANPVQAA
jgi:AraC-like DNA-binding protein